MVFKDIILQSHSDNKKSFNLESSVIETSFISNLILFKTNKIWRFVIELSEDIKIDKNIEDLKGVVRIFMHFDFVLYEKLADSEKKRMLIDILMDGIKILCNKFDISFKPFEEAYDRTLEQGIKYSTYWKKEKKNKSRLWSGRIFMELDFGVSKIEAHLTNTKTGEQIKKLLVNPKPNYMYFDRFLGKYYWDDEGNFCLESKDKKTILKASPYGLSLY